MKSGQCVLVVDGQAETEQVLKAVLEPRGLRIDRIRAAFPAAGSPGDARSPDVVIIDADDAHYGACESDHWDRMPRVILGTARLSTQTSGEQFLQKPFQYGELISAIERLLSARRV